MSALFLAAKKWKQPKFPLTHEWINKIGYVHTMPFFITQRNEVITEFPQG
jgi:hypothetical protein